MRPVLDGTTPRHSLLWRLFSVNAAVLVTAAAVLLLSPITVSSPVNAGEGIIIFAGLLGMIGLDLLLLRRALAPLSRLRLAMRSVDPLSPGRRVDPGARSADVAELTTSFNDMLDRLESERRASARNAQAAQEAERRWLSLELHDEIGQNLTALLLQIDVAAAVEPAAQAPALEAARDTARESLERIRGIVNHLRPEALDDLGLHSAVAVLGERFAERSGVTVTQHIDDELPELDPESELVVYRVAQEALTNVARHSGSDHADLLFHNGPAGVVMTVSDHGRGLLEDEEPGSGIRGMRERAGLIGAGLKITPGADGRGCEVTLAVKPRQETGSA